MVAIQNPAPPAESRSSGSTDIQPQPSHNDPAIQQALAQYTATGDPQLLAELTRRFDRVVQWLVGKYVHRGVDSDDLLQAGRIGLVEALQRYDPERGVPFLTYAISTIVGEIKHHMRDDTWGVRVPRRLQELSQQLMRLEDQLTAELGHSPSVREMAEHAGVSEEAVLAAMELPNLHQLKSLNVMQSFEDSTSSEEWQDLMGGTDSRLEAVVAYEPLYHALEGIDDRKSWILRRRYFEEWSQREVAEELGLSQMHISRLEREALASLREQMELSEEPALA